MTEDTTSKGKKGNKSTNHDNEEKQSSDNPEEEIGHTTSTEEKEKTEDTAPPDSSDSDDYSDAEESPDSWLCKLCSKTFTDKNAKLLECERCQQRFCITCLKIKVSEYRVLCIRSDLHWFCKSCEPKAIRSWEIDEVLEKRFQAFEISMSEKLNKMEERYNQKLEQMKTERKMKPNADNPAVDSGNNKDVPAIQVAAPAATAIAINAAAVEEDRKEDTETQEKNESWSEIVRGKQGKSNREVADSLTIAQIVKQAIEETGLKAKEQTVKQNDREANIIIHRAPESKANTWEERWKEDEGLFNKLCEKGLGVGKLEFERLFRLGSPDDEKTRPLKVILKNVDAKIELMRSLGKLQDAEEVLRNLSITNDMTADEREENRRLVEEAKKKSQEDTSGHWIYKVRGPPWHRRVVRLKKEAPKEMEIQN